MEETNNKKGTGSYSESQKLALHYVELANDPSWRPVCPDCKSTGCSVYMIKLTNGFLCIRCKREVNNAMIGSRS